MDSNNYPVIFDYPFTALAVLGLVDILLPLLVFYFASRIGNFVWPLHGLAILFLVVSPFILFYLVTPETAPDEAPGPGDGFIALPLFGILLLELPIYFIALVIVAWRKFFMNSTNARAT